MVNWSVIPTNNFLFLQDFHERMLNRSQTQTIQSLGHAWLSVVKATLVLAFCCVTLFGQNIDVNKVAADLEPEIRRAMIEGNIPSATVALVSGDKVIWTGSYGESNLWARTPTTTNTVYLIGSTFKA